jgi:hypothetical protein
LRSVFNFSVLSEEIELNRRTLYLVKKTRFVLASHWKIALPMKEMPAVNTGTFFLPPPRVFHISPCRKSLPVPGRKLFTFPKDGKLFQSLE